MSVPRKWNGQNGVTLIEVTLAVAIFSVAIAMSAQALISFYAAVDVQEQRAEAMQAARAVLAEARQKRLDFELPNDQFNWNGMLSWFGQMQSANWDNFLRNDTAANTLKNHVITVTVLDMEGNVAQNGDNPLEVHVRSSWTDLRGREASVEVVGVIGER